MGTGDPSSPLAVQPVLNPPVPGGASAAIVQAITVNVKADCGNIAPAPHLEVYVNGALIGGVDVTSSTFADTAPFTVNPTRYASEIAVAFTNDSQAGSCDHNLYVDHVTLTTANGPMTLRADDAAHVIYDYGGNFFDNVDVLPASVAMGYSGALRFFIAPAPLHAPPPTAPSYVQPPTWAYSATGPVSGWTPLWSANVTLQDSSTLWLSLHGHWEVSSTWCYATLLLDGVPAAATCSTAANYCWGAAHTYSTSWEALSYQAFFRAGPGVHSISVAVVPYSGTTCTINGARIFYTALPL